ncbi:hypothetical protein Bca101_055890 [Brassica carinata]
MKKNLRPFENLLLFCLFVSSTHIASVSCLNSDGLTLLSLLKHLEKVPKEVTSTWKLNSSSEATPCNWFGITCDDSNNVASLNFTRSEVSGQLGPEIGELRSLEILDLSTNSLSGTIPSTLGNCTKLVYLDLSENEFTGEIPDTLGNLKSVMDLYLYVNYLTGELPESLFRIPVLQTFSVEYNNLNGSIPESIGEAKELLDLRTNPGFGSPKPYFANSATDSLTSTTGGAWCFPMLSPVPN